MPLVGSLTAFKSCSGSGAGGSRETERSKEHNRAIKTQGDIVNRQLTTKSKQQHHCSREQQLNRHVTRIESHDWSNQVTRPRLHEAMSEFASLWHVLSRHVFGDGQGAKVHSPLSLFVLYGVRRIRDGQYRGGWGEVWGGCVHGATPLT